MNLIPLDGNDLVPTHLDDQAAGSLKCIHQVLFFRAALGCWVVCGHDVGNYHTSETTTRDYIAIENGETSVKSTIAYILAIVYFGDMAESPEGCPERQRLFAAFKAANLLLI